MQRTIEGKEVSSPKIEYETRAGEGNVYRSL
jgi:hypothetical protein